MVEDDEDDVTDQHAGGDAVHIEKIKPVVDEAVSVPSNMIYFNTNLNDYFHQYHYITNFHDYFHRYLYLA